jgi:hypothetical protein
MSRSSIVSFLFTTQVTVALFTNFGVKDVHVSPRMVRVGTEAKFSVADKAL